MGSVTVDIPPLDPNRPAPRIAPTIFVHATVSAENTQHVRISNNQEGENKVEFYWVGKGSKQIGADVIQRKNFVQSFTVTIEHNPGLLTVQKPSDVRNPEKLRSGVNTIQVVKSEDGGDQDYDDAVVYFTYLDNTVDSQQQSKA